MIPSYEMKWNQLAEEAWRRFANEIGAEFVENRVVAKVKGWTITFDTYEETDQVPQA